MFFLLMKVNIKIQIRYRQNKKREKARKNQKKTTKLQKKKTILLT